MPRDGSGPSGTKPDASQTPRPETEGLALSQSPVDLPDPPVPLPDGLGWATKVIAWASLVLVLLNAHAIQSWSYQLPPGAASAQVVNAAEAWYDLAGQAGLNRPVETMHAWWQMGRDLRFRRDEPAPDRALPEPSASPRTT